MTTAFSPAMSRPVVGLSLQPARKMPTFPLSSPINEELVTPFDEPDSPTLGGMSDSNNNHNNDNDDNNDNPFDSPEDSLLASTSQKTQTKSRGRKNSTRRSKRLNPSRKTRPGLNLVTNFSTKSAVPPPEQVKGVAGNTNTNTINNNNNNNNSKHFVGLGDLMTLSDVRQLDRSRLLPGWKKPSARGYDDLDAPARSGGRVGKRTSFRKFAKRGNGKGQELSPSDRPIPIGISVPFGSPEADTTGTITMADGSRRRDSFRSEKSHNTPVTPSIVITPAAANDRDNDNGNGNGWGEPWKHSPPRRARPASSVYSQPTPLMKNNNDNKTDSIPPVPALPPPGAYDNWFGTYDIPIEQQNPMPPSSPAGGRRRALSDGTVFEEDYSPSKLHARARASSVSVHSRHAASNRFSMDTIATRPRSQGWWNVLLSPLLSRSSTMTTLNRVPGTPNEEKEKLPAMPTTLNVPDQTAGNNAGNYSASKQDNYMSEKGWEQQQQQQQQVSVFSPITPDSAGRDGKVESCVTEWPGPDDWGVGHEKSMMSGNGNGYFNKNNYNDIKNNKNSSPRLRQVDNANSPASMVSSQSIPFVMSHSTGDTNTNTNTGGCGGGGFFHSPLRGGAEFGYGSNRSAEKPRGNAKYSPGTPAGNSPSSPFFRRFVETLRNDRRLSRCRSDSGSTMIEEDEPDVSPNVREAKATPIFRGGVTPTMVDTSLSSSSSRNPKGAKHDSSRTSLTTNHHGLFVSTAMAERGGVVESPQPSAKFPEPGSKGKKKNKPARKYRAILPPDLLQPPPVSPGPLSPEGQSHLANGTGGIQMANVPLPQQPDVVYGARLQRGLPPRPHHRHNHHHHHQHQHQHQHHQSISTDTTANSSTNTRYVPDPYAVHRVDIESRRQKLEREDAVGQKVGGFWCCSKRRKQGYFTKKGPEGRKRRRWCLALIIILLLLLIGLGIALAVIFTRKDGDGGGQTNNNTNAPGTTETTVITTPFDPDNTGTASPTKPTTGSGTPKPSETSGAPKEPDRPDWKDERWLNLTGYPPMPTGISTVAGPDAAVARGGCMQQSSMWSCALPKDERESNRPFDGNQPRFKFDVRFKNGTYERGTELKRGKRGGVLWVARKLGILERLESSGFVQRRADDDDDDFTPSPKPPSLQEQAFLGNTTDEIAGRFEGEETPFFVTFLSTSSSSSSSDNDDEKTDKRTLLHSRSNSSSSDFPDLTALIPPPDLASDGTAAPANLYPLPISQPLRLYDRSLDSEHYGFYTYFNRSIFLKSARPIGQDDKADISDDLNGGSTKSAARVRCTWTQTRFLVRIWTRPAKAGMQLLPESSPSTPESGGGAGAGATDFNRPGSFPYPVTVSLDRHGGEPEGKMVYCYGLETDGQVNGEEKKLQLEWREFGGNIVSPAPGVFNVSSATSSNGGGRKDDDDDTKKDNDKDKRDGDGDGGDSEVEAKGFDGGTGGCRCEWRNWLR